MTALFCFRPLDRLIRYQAGNFKSASSISSHFISSRPLGIHPLIHGSTPKMATVDADSAVAIAAEFFACKYLSLAPRPILTFIPQRSIILRQKWLFCWMRSDQGIIRLWVRTITILCCVRAYLPDGPS